jgi:predicted heme/steroid binding protein
LANYYSIDSEISATFSEIRYLIRTIYSTGNQYERNLALTQLYNQTTHLKFLVQFLQTERDTVLQQQPRPNAIHPFQQSQTNTIPVQAGVGINQTVPTHPYRLSQPINSPQQLYQSPSILDQSVTEPYQSMENLYQSPRPPYQSMRGLYQLPQTPFSSAPNQFRQQYQTQEQFQSAKLTQSAQAPFQPSRLPFSGVQQQRQIQSPTPVGNPNGQTFSREQLTQFTGMNGMPAYVAVNGVVYDVTNNAAWSLATHFGLRAGNDLTGEFASCHAGQNWILAQLKPVGRLV